MLINRYRQAVSFKKQKAKTMNRQSYRRKKRQMTNNKKKCLTSAIEKYKIK